MATEIKLEPGWLRRDVQTAADRMSPAKPTPKADDKGIAKSRAPSSNDTVTEGRGTTPKRGR
jgi:hypothetical protein